MRRIYFIVRLMLVVAILIMPVLPVLADTSAEITVTAKPLFTNGIINFVITYISETQLDLSWGFEGDAVNIMIRGKYGDYPDDIPDEDTEPSDGYEVYYGSATSASDTTMDFDQNPGLLYYKAWAQKGDGKWYVQTDTGYQESAIMTLLFFLFFAVCMSYLSTRTSYWVLKFMAGMAWFAAGIYWLNSPPSTIVAGSATDTAVLVLLFFIGIAFIFMPFWYSKTQDGQEVSGRLRLPFMRTDEQEEMEQKTRYKPSRSERTSAYQTRVTNALNGRITRRD